MLFNFFNEQHTLVINLATKQIWCYLCDRELTAPLIKSDKNDVGSAFDNKISKYINILYDLLSPPLVHVLLLYFISSVPFSSLIFVSLIDDCIGFL
jgi:hypothetical protein